MSVNADKQIENDEFLVNSIRDVTIDFKSKSGTDDDTHRYLWFNGYVTSYEIRTDQIIQISEVNGRVLKNPITINTSKSFIMSRRTRMRWENIKLKVLTVNTNIKIIAFSTGSKAGE